MKQAINKRLTALEQAEQASSPRFPAITPALMSAYGTEAAGKPAIDRRTFEKALDQVYSA
jgi:hypothetical protein